MGRGGRRGAPHVRRRASEPEAADGIGRSPTPMTHSYSMDEEGEECNDGAVLLYPGDIVTAKYRADGKYYLATVELENVDGSYWLRWIEGGKRALWAHPRNELRLVQGPRREAPSSLGGPAPGLESLGEYEAPCEDGRCYAGDVVWARWRDRRWYVALIAKENGDGTFLLDWCDNHAYDRIVLAKHVRRLPFYHVDDGVRFYVSQARRAFGRFDCLSESSSSESGSVAGDSAEVAFASVSSQEEAATASSEFFASAASDREEALAGASAQDLLRRSGAAAWLVLEVSEGEEDSQESSPEEEGSIWGSIEVSGREEEEEEEIIFAESLAAERRRQRQLEKVQEAKSSEEEEEEVLSVQCKAAAPEEVLAEAASSKLPASGKLDPSPEIPATPFAKVGKAQDPPIVAPRAKAGSLPEPLPEPSPEPAVGPLESSLPPTPAPRASSAAASMEAVATLAKRGESSPISGGRGVAAPVPVPKSWQAEAVPKAEAKDQAPQAAASSSGPDAKAEPRRGGGPHARAAQEAEEADGLLDLSAPPSAKLEQWPEDAWASSGAELRQALQHLQALSREAAGMADERPVAEDQQAAGVFAARQLEDAPRRTAVHLIMRSEEATATAPEEVGPASGFPQSFAMCEDEPTTEEESGAVRYQHVSLCEEDPTTEEEMAGRLAKGSYSGSVCSTPPIREEPELEEMYEFDNEAFEADLGFGNAAASSSSSSRSIWGNFGFPHYAWPSSWRRPS